MPSIMMQANTGGKMTRKVQHQPLKALGTTKTTARVDVQSESIHLVGIVGN